jgi:hypothetical protein
MSDVATLRSDAIRRFLAPAPGDIHAARLGAALGLPLGPRLRSRLLDCDRIKPRLAELVARRLALVSDAALEFATPLSRLAWLDSAGLVQASRLAGATWHARSLRAIILAAPRAAVIEALGDAAYAFGIGNADLAVAPATRATPEELVAAIDLDGQLCLGAWLETLDAGVAERVRLKLSPSPALERPAGQFHREGSPPILARVAAELSASPERS